MDQSSTPSSSRPQTGWRTETVEQLGLLIDAQHYYREFYRAAEAAEHFILLSGWQFDSDVALLRGVDAENVEYPVTLLKFLDALCRRKPNLSIWILAWDFHVVFAIEREWMQELVFRWSTSERLQFRFDASHVENGSHHQKFVVIDGQLSFLGGLDLCDHRWDERSHRYKNPLRISRGEPHKPFHDVQAFLRGPAVAGALSELFVDRWKRAGGEPIVLPKLTRLDMHASHAVTSLTPLAANAITLSRTDPHGSPDGKMPCTEVRDLFVDAVLAAESLLYIETQYLSSHIMGEALERRMRAHDRPKLEIVILLNMEAETFKEQLAVGLAQAKIIARMREVAAETGQRLGIYYTLPECEPDELGGPATYIHSKLMIVDDRWLAVGSANLTNRSLSVDTELVASVNADVDAAGDALARTILDVRAELLAEHTGGANVTLTEGLVAHLDELATRAENGDVSCPCRLRHHPSPTADELRALAIIDPQALPFDPDNVEDLRAARPLFVGGFGTAMRRLFDLA
jgi:phospholipase D1/2